MAQHFAHFVSIFRASMVACLMVATLVPANTTRAIESHERSHFSAAEHLQRVREDAEEGSALAQFFMGTMYQLGEIVLRRDMTLELIDELNELCTRPGVNGGMERREKMRWVIKALVNNAMAGDNAAILAIYDRLEGKPAQKVVGPDNGPVKIQLNTIEEVKAFLLERGIDVERLPNPMKYLDGRRGE